MSEALKMLWIEERLELYRQLREDVSFVECVPFPWQRQLRQKMPGVKLVGAVTGPQKHGKPHLRTRVHLACLNAATTVWCGGSTDDEVQADFDGMFEKATVMHGTEFCMAEDSDVHAEYLRLAKNQGL